MNVGTILLYVSLVTVWSAAVLMFAGRTKLSVTLTRITAALVTLLVLLLAYAFVVLDFSLYTVWLHSSAELSVFYRLAAILIGQEGTYLVWAWLTILVVLQHMEMRGVHNKSAQLANAYALVGCAFLLVLTFTMNPFKSIFLTAGASLPTSGNGLNPMLVDILMPLHIFSTFAAYAFTIIPAAVSLAYFTRREKMSNIQDYLRFSWLFLSISMIAGGIWANRLLGWTGYWQWDPIQSITLAIWLLLTAALHGDSRFKMGRYGRLFPFACILVFVGCVYATLVARCDAYGSIHSFPGTPTWWMLVIFMAIILVFSLILIVRSSVDHQARHQQIYQAFEPYNTFDFTVVTLIAMAFVAVWGPTVHVIFWLIGLDIFLPPIYYNALFYLPIIFLTYLTGICILYKKVENRLLAYVVIIYLAFSIILAFVVPYSPHTITPSTSVSHMENLLGSISVMSYIPAFFFVAGSLIYKTIIDLKVKNKLVSLYLTGSNLIHAGFILVIMGAIISTSFATTYHFSYDLDEKNILKENEDVGIRFLDFKVEPVGSEWFQIVDLEVIDDGTYITSTVFYKSRQFGLISRPAVRYGLFSDIQVGFMGSVPHQIDLESIEVSVKKQPFVSLSRCGWVFMIMGLLFIFMSNIMQKRRRAGPE